MRGRKPKPIEQQIIEGDPRKHGVHVLEEKQNKMPKAERGLPNAPAHLGPVAAAQWSIWKADLERMNEDYRPDAVMLEGACIMYERVRALDKLVGERVLMPLDELDRAGKPTGRKKFPMNPAFRPSLEVWRELRAFCTEFGLSPVSRQRLHIDAGAEDSHAKLVELLEAPRLPKEQRKERVQ